MGVVSGADGCRAGWVVVTRDLATGAVTWRLGHTVQELFYDGPAPQIMALDIPIGLPERGPRACDLEARQLLGRPRASSVFPAPPRPVLAARSYEEACAIRSCIEGKKLSLQAWAIVEKIRQVDAALRADPGLRTRVREVHPEVSFYFLNGGRPLPHGKKSQAGREERSQLLGAVLGPWLQAALSERRSLESAEDDILDAFVALWTAERIAAGLARTIPAVPPTDNCGLRMEIVA
jgi:predicted RNase H-like nuclease